MGHRISHPRLRPPARRVRVVCSVDGRVDGLTVTVRLKSDTVAGPQPQVVSMLPKTSRSDSRVKRTVEFGANLMLIEASREEETSDGPVAPSS